MLLMEYYKLWDTPLDGEAWSLFRELSEDGTFEDFDRFSQRVPRASRDYVLFDRVCCSFEQAGVLMKHGLLHPDLYFDAWASPSAAWEKARVAIEGLREQSGNHHVFENFEWLARRSAEWNDQH